jgi:hypothetical protein
MCSATSGHHKRQLIHLALHQQKQTTLSEWISMCLFHEWHLWFETKYWNKSAKSIDFVTFKYPVTGNKFIVICVLCEGHNE